MGQASTQRRAGRPRRRTRDQVYAEETHCHLCGNWVDQTLPRWPKPHPLSASVDELVPVHDGGNPDDRTNCRLAHRCCNTSRWCKPITEKVRARCRQLYTSHAAHFDATTTTYDW